MGPLGGVQLVLMLDHDEREVFRRHGAEGVLLAGGGAAILLQLADPRVARGVAAHSGFRDRPLDRLLGTLDYVYAVGFGDDETVAAAVRTVNARHVPVRGAADGGRPAYSAFDADAQRWVASTLLGVALALHERLWGPLDEPTADAVVRGYAPIGFHLQATREGWPETRAEFDRWWIERLAGLEVGGEATIRGPLAAVRRIRPPRWHRGAAAARPAHHRGAPPGRDPERVRLQLDAPGRARRRGLVHGPLRRLAPAPPRRPARPDALLAPAHETSQPLRWA